jgi:hypothetical protein
LSGLDLLAWGASAATASWLAVTFAGKARLGGLTATATTVMIAVAAFAVAVTAYAAMTRRR